MAAFEFYKSVFGGELNSVKYKDLQEKMGLSGKDLELCANASLTLPNGYRLYGSDVPDMYSLHLTAGNRYELNIQAESGNEAKKLFDALSAGGKVDMDMEKTEWAELFGSCTDKFGIKWMVMFIGNGMKN